MTPVSVVSSCLQLLGIYAEESGTRSHFSLNPSAFPLSVVIPPLLYICIHSSVVDTVSFSYLQHD